MNSLFLENSYTELWLFVKSWKFILAATKGRKKLEAVWKVLSKMVTKITYFSPLKIRMWVFSEKKICRNISKINQKKTGLLQVTVFAQKQVGVPILYLNQQAIILEKPSEATSSGAAEIKQKSSDLTDFEKVNDCMNFRKNLKTFIISFKYEKKF